MSVFNRRNAVIGWFTWTVGKHAVKYAAKDAAKGAAPSVDPVTKKPNKSAIALGAATAVGVVMFWKKRSGGGDDEPARLSTTRPSQSADSPERAAFGVAADREALAGMHDAPAELDDACLRGSDVVDAEVGQREAVTRPRPALVHAERRAVAVRLPSRAFIGRALVERQREQPFPEARRACEVVGGELDQVERHQAYARCLAGRSSSPSR